MPPPADEPPRGRGRPLPGNVLLVLGSVAVAGAVINLFTASVTPREGFGAIAHVALALLAAGVGGVLAAASLLADGLTRTPRSRWRIASAAALSALGPVAAVPVTAAAIDTTTPWPALVALVLVVIPLAGMGQARRMLRNGWWRVPTGTR